jgi:hypothetical protein
MMDKKAALLTGEFSTSIGAKITFQLLKEAAVHCKMM